MNRRYLLDSLDGLKALVFHLLPSGITSSVACVPMTTDGPWTKSERAVFENALGIATERTFWNPGGFDNVPPSGDVVARSRWVDAVAAINHRYLFLDPDTGFFTHHNGASEKKVLVSELRQILQSREAVIVYRHQWRCTPLDDGPPNAYPYVWRGLRMLRDVDLKAFAYQSQQASLFFLSSRKASIEPFYAAFQRALAGVSAEVVARRLVRCR
jgi:hypothetical protein